MLLVVSAALAFDPTLSVGAAYDLHASGDAMPGGFAWNIRGGLQQQHFDLELAVLGHTGVAVGSDWPSSQVAPRLEVAWHPDHAWRLDPFLALGVGYRYNRIDDGTEARKDVETRYGFTADPIVEALFSGGGGATFTIWGPIHLRADVRGLLLLGPDKEGYTLGAGEFTLAVEYRSEGAPDADRDGVSDKKDVCPDSKEDLDYFEDLDGCFDPDDDKDGVADVADRCKDDDEDLDGFEDTDGCPDRNNDKDNVPDEIDGCPDEAETENNYKDADGCPDTTPAALVAIDDRTLLGLTWTGDTLDETARPVVDALAATLLAHPDVRLKISCFTDDQGELSKLTDRTDRRAEGLRDLLVSAGNKADRFELVGWGARFAIKTNDTPEGRLANNRCSTMLID